ncbi:MAG TPA: RagB/SusD family nutrient uptake outer membrane protein [Puia sp.]|nr:RagB/SusD family nutrient uptake outer membrane protein [Puia sp.]
MNSWFVVRRMGMILLLIVWVLSGCKKLDLAPSDRYTELTFWQVDDNVNNALNNIYNGIFTSNPYFYNEALSDNAYTRLGISAGNVDAISSGSFTVDLNRFSSDWAYYYAGIKSCNIFLSSVDKNTTLSADIRNRMKAEAQFVRAWHYFNLMKWWGDVPLIKEDITPDQAKVEVRTPRADVLKFILDELDAAAAALPTRDQYGAADKGRVTKGAALALKARVLLYEGDRMADVVSICEQLMNDQSQNGTYSLHDNYEELFQAGSKYNSEVIFDLGYVLPARAWGDYIDFAPLSAGARSNNLAPTQELVDSYIMTNGKAIGDAGSGYDENNPYVNRDPRLSATVVYDQFVWKNADGSTQKIYIKPGSSPVGQDQNEYKASGQGTATGYYWRKYWDLVSVPTLQFGSNLILIRYAEVLLMYAEAKNSLGQMTSDVWDKTIKALRQRAGFTDPGALDFPGAGADLTAIIRNERRSEFAFEGLRIDDIRRWKIAETVMNGWAHGARYGDPAIDNGYLRAQLRTFDKNKHYLWPVPSSELVKDGKLTQNPNYQ